MEFERVENLGIACGINALVHNKIKGSIMMGYTVRRY